MVECALYKPAIQKSGESKTDIPEVTIVVLNYNGKKYIHDCLNSIFRMNYPNFKVLVIDNASWDSSPLVVKQEFPRAKLVEHRRNHGFAKAYNMALVDVDSEFIVLLNNDVKVEPDWLNELIHVISGDDKISAVTPKMLFKHDTNLINAAGGKCDIYGSGWNRGNGENDIGQYEKIEEVFYVNFGAVVIRKNAWKDVGSLDEQYFLYGEDLDWCWRARLKGYKIYYIPQARVYHEWRGSRGPMIPLLERNWLMTAIKNFDSVTLLKLAPRFVSLKAAVGVWLLLKGRSLSEKFAVPNGFIWNLKKFGQIWKNRLLIQASRKIDDSEIRRFMYNGSLELSLGLRRIRHPIVDN